MANACLSSDCVVRDSCDAGRDPSRLRSTFALNVNVGYIWSHIVTPHRGKPPTAFGTAAVPVHFLSVACIMMIWHVVASRHLCKAFVAHSESPSLPATQLSPPAPHVPANLIQLQQPVVVGLGACQGRTAPLMHSHAEQQVRPKGTVRNPMQRPLTVPLITVQHTAQYTCQRAHFVPSQLASLASTMYTPMRHMHIWELPDKRNRLTA